MIRWVGAGLVVLATSLAGYEYGRNLQKRISQLKELKKIVTDLYSDIEYGACSLSESFARISEQQSELYRAFLLKICAGMKKEEPMESRYGMPFSMIFTQAVTEMLSGSALTESDKKGLLRFGSQLGNNQKKGQLRILQLYLQELDYQIEELQKTRVEKQKTGQMLGISVGVLVVILLL